jgi:hypothetical protein
VLATLTRVVTCMIRDVGSILVVEPITWGVGEPVVDLVRLGDE